MYQGVLSQNKYKPIFSGHETFPMRYGWLKKAYDALKDNRLKKSVFTDPQAISRFGVGRNMVASIRYWANAAGIIKEVNQEIEFTELGKIIFDNKDGLDPYIENPSSLWVIHWNISGNPRNTTWYWAFNHYPDSFFEREHLVKSLLKIANEMNWQKISENTIKRDVDCFVRTYAQQKHSKKKDTEESFESPLIELNLLKQIGSRDGFRLIRSEKTTLDDYIFAYAVVEYWKRHSEETTLSFEKLVYHPGSPGRVFLLDEDSTMNRIQNLEKLTDGLFTWSETAGLMQLIKTSKIPKNFQNKLLRACYHLEK